MKKKFELGRILMAKGINDKVADDEKFAKFVTDSLKRHANGDWGDLHKEDRQENELSLKEGLRVFSVYQYGEGKIWIITEADRETTTVSLPEEY